MDKLRLKMSKAAYRALTAWSADSARKELLTLSLELPLLLRRHGLLATLALWSNAGADQAEAKLARAFLNALQAIAPVGGHQGVDSVQRLQTEPLYDYLLHSRLALALADAWVELAKPMLKADAAP